MRALLFAMVGATWLAGAAVPARAGEDVALHPDVWTAYEAYLGKRWPGAFAVSRDGAAYGHAACTTVMCDLSAAKREALQSCRNAGGTGCIVFAVRDEIRLGYRVLTREEASVCPLSPAPRIAVSLDAEEPGFDHSRDVADLADMIKESERHWLDSDGTFMGVTRQSFGQIGKTVRYDTVDGKNGATCAGFSDGEVRLELRATIYIAREIPEGTCLYREVLAHEQRHQALGAEMMAEHARKLEATIAAALTDEPYVEVPAGAQAWKVSADRLDGIISAARTVFDREHSRRQMAIDSQEEYERTDMVCPGEAEKFLP